MAKQKKNKNRWIILVTCSLSLIIITMDSSIVSIALSSIQRGIGGTISTLQWVTDAYVLALGSFLLLSGSVADHIGRKKIFMLGLLSFAVTSFFCGIAWNAASLISFRIIQGIAASSLTTVAMSIITNVFLNPAERAQAIGIYGACTGVSLGLSAPIGGILLHYFSWSSIFFVNVPIALIAFLLAYAYVPESSSGTSFKNYDIRGQILMMLSLCSVIFALIELPQWGLVNWKSVIIIIFIMVTILLFISTENQARHPIINLKYFKLIAFTGATIIVILGFSIFNGFLFINSIFLQNVEHFSPLKSGITTLPLAISAFIISPISGYLVGHHGTKIPLILCGFCMLCANILALYSIQSKSMIIMLLVYCTLGIGFGFLNAPTMSTATSSLPISESGISAGIINSGKQIGNCLGVALLGIVSNLGTLNPSKTSGKVLLSSMVPAYIMFVLFSTLIIAFAFLSTSKFAKKQTTD